MSFWMDTFSKMKPQNPVFYDHADLGPSFLLNGKLASYVLVRSFVILALIWSCDLWDYLFLPLFCLLSDYRIDAESSSLKIKLDGMTASRDLVDEGHELASKQTTVTTIEVIVVVVTLLLFFPSSPSSWFLFGGMDVIMVSNHSGVKGLKHIICISLLIDRILAAPKEREQNGSPGCLDF